MNITIKSIVIGDPQNLSQEVQQREQRIAQIKQEVGQDWDNVNDPVPVLQMLEDS